MDDETVEDFLGFLAYGAYQTAETGKMPPMGLWSALTPDTRRCWHEVAKTMISFHKTLLADPASIQAMIDRAVAGPKA